ncbi:hypothetical protein [Gordonia sp. SL306]|uniref:hypothetical protein n=1 Tax=Gordonia sp. SL306 TaxID=2995145 RepID=UPI00226DB60E|nr:hypothetical protein [Gordonia sp. SL306]WAC56927.1 hypothetical protein OVA31_06690 [Gordonia sp. SL306]
MCHTSERATTPANLRTIGEKLRTIGEKLRTVGGFLGTIGAELRPIGGGIASTVGADRIPDRTVDRLSMVEG